MKSAMKAAGIVLALALGMYFFCKHLGGEWKGVDETVVEKFAEQAGRPSKKPLINTDQGDLLLFVFLIAGSAGGFVAGYYFRVLFPPEGARAPGPQPENTETGNSRNV